MAITAAPSPKTHQQLKAKPRLSLWQIFTMSFGFLGIQFGFALQNGNTSRILRSFGAECVTRNKSESNCFVIV